MYHPYFRGKQFELITIREMAPVFKQAGFRPIIEPVRETLSGLHKALLAVSEVGGKAIVIVNPQHGEFSNSGSPLSRFLAEEFNEVPGIAAGVLLKPSTSTSDAMKCFNAHASHSPVFIHAGFGDPKSLIDQLNGITPDQCHIFSEDFCRKLYRKHFSGAHRVLLQDGFKRMRNKDYELVEHFSDLHATFRDEGMDGFGDFLIVGDDYSEDGGPAYAIAIHLTFIDPEKDDSMFIYHFVSDRRDTPKDPAGKFAEALANMVKILNRHDSKVLETEAVKEFRALHRAGHFPGLGYVKKLSMNHHIETLADYFEKLRRS